MNLFRSPTPLVLALLTACVFAPPSSPHVLTKEEYAVYASFLTTTYPSNEVSQIVVRLEAESTPPLDRVLTYTREGFWSPQHQSAAREETIRAYWHAQQIDAVLDPAPLGVDHAVVTTSEDIRVLRDAFPERRWDAIDEHFGANSVLVALSRIGFSDDGTQALLHVSELACLVCGIGYFALLERSDEGWKVVSTLVTFIT